jgi:multidrug efflux pump
MVGETASKTLAPTMGVEWTELSLLQIMESNDFRNKIVFPLAVIFVFLVLSAQYESWSLPLAVILVVPVCIFSALIGTIVGMTGINLFTEIGLVVLVGLCSKNSILIVEFAKDLHEKGMPLKEATIDACKLRLRPILMTSFAFILGVLPLVIANGAGAEMRKALGIAVFAGMLGVTMLGVLFTPVFFYIIQCLDDMPFFHSKWAKNFGRAAYLLLSIGTLGLFVLLRKGTIRGGDKE